MSIHELFIAYAIRCTKGFNDHMVSWTKGKWQGRFHPHQGNGVDSVFDAELYAEAGKAITAKENLEILGAQFEVVKISLSEEGTIT